LERYAEAETIYRKVIELSPSESPAYYLLGVLLHNHLDRFDEAEKFYTNAIKLDPSNVDFYDGLVGLFRFKLDNRLKDTILLLEKMVEINPEDFNSYLAIASISKLLNQDIPDHCIEKVRQFMPEDDWYNRACLESVCDNFDSAFEYLRKAAQREKFDPAWAWEDPDLQWIRNDPRFVEIVGPKP
jgi:tetratricopeptide (TPR) repeat protein